MPDHDTVTTGLMIEVKETDDAVQGGVGRRPWVGKAADERTAAARPARKGTKRTPSRAGCGTKHGAASGAEV